IVIPLYYDSANPGYLIFRVIHSLILIKHTFVLDTDRPMLSAECGAFESMLRSSPQVDYDLKADPLKIAKEMRASFSIDKVVHRPAGCQFKKQIYEYDRQTVEAYWIDYRTGTKNWDADLIILYLHGGGYRVGDFQSKLG
ncbi:unnamed protein product, partial [Rotaria sp. Silwood2]